MLDTAPSESREGRSAPAVAPVPPPRILVITDAFFPHAGGARTYYYQLFQGLADRGLADLTILTKKVPAWEAFDAAQSRPGFRIVRAGTPLPTRHWKQWPKLAIPAARSLPLLATGRFDLIHFGDLFPPGLMSLGFRRVLGMPYVGYAHGEEITQVDQRRFQPIIRDAIYGRAARVIAANEFARENLLRIGIPNNHITKITPGVDYERFRPEPPRADLLDRFQLHGKRVLLTVARLAPRKGHRMVMSAMAKLQDSHPDLLYLIAGTGKEREALEGRASELGILDRVRFAGYVPEDDLPAYYNLCDLFVMPNFEEPGTGDLEGFGMVFLEANACGKPVLGGRSGGTAEAVLHGKTGLLVDPMDAGAVAEGIRQLLLPEVSGEMGRTGLHRARTEFDWASRIEALDAVNRQIVRSRG